MSNIKNINSKSIAEIEQLNNIDIKFPTQLKLYLHCDGANASQSLQDLSRSNHSITCIATAQLSTSEKKFGTASLLLDGNSDYLTIADSSDWDFGTGDFTIEGWFNLVNLSSRQWIVGPGPTSWGLSIESSTSIGIWRSDSGVLHQFITVSEMSADTWYHIAVSRNGNNLRLFLDGVQQGATIDATSYVFNYAQTMLIGAYSIASPQGFFGGYIDEFRIWNGLALYTTGFTVESSQYLQPIKNVNKISNL